MSNTGIYAMTDGVTDEDFEQALKEARAEGNLSRTNVARKAKAKAQPVEPDRSENVVPIRPEVQYNDVQLADICNALNRFLDNMFNSEDIGKFTPACKQMMVKSLREAMNKLERAENQ